MFERLVRWFSPPVFEGDEEKTNSAGLLNTLLIALGLFACVGTVLVLLSSAVRWQYNLAFGVVLVSTSVAMLVVMRRGRVRLAAVVLCIALWALVTWQIYVDQGGIRGSTGSIYFVIVIISGLLLGRKAIIIFGALVSLTIAGLYVLEVTETIPVHLSPLASSVDLILLELVFAFAVLLLRVVVIRTTDALSRASRNEAELVRRNRELQEIRGGLEQRVYERTRNLEAVAEVARTITTVLDPVELERRIVNLVRESFGLYYAGLFLVDETGAWTGEPNRWVVLRAGTGEAGQLMIEREHRFALDDPNSMIARCIAEKQAIIALDVGEEARRFDNPLLPDTHSEMALPLVSRGQVLGAMTIQSDRVAAFSETAIAAMQTMADQIAGALDNARSFAAAQVSLARSEEIVRRYVRESWESYASTEPVSGYLYATGRVGPNNRAWLPVMDEALRRHDLVVEQRATDAEAALPGEGMELAVPLFFGEEVIGTIGLRRESERAWSQEEIELVRDVSLQVAQAVETRRLFEETQRSARRESTLRRTADRVRSQANLDALLRTAVQEIQRAVGASHVAIRLGTEETLASSASRPVDEGVSQDA
ncbi:MAG: GAF domain-containing protein [Anaerolineae bacterium]|nr:GAF domain-containing protein [Anaerolineae bacterium]